jgi:hypothetical protein
MRFPTPKIKVIALFGFISIFVGTGIYLTWSEGHRVGGKTLVEQKVLNKLDNRLNNALIGEVAILGSSQVASAAVPKVESTPREYQRDFDQYIKVSDVPTKDDQVAAKMLVAELLHDLRAKRMSSADQEKVLYRMGKFFYHQALFSKLDGYPASVKVKLLRLAIEHLNESKRSSL